MTAKGFGKNFHKEFFGETDARQKVCSKSWLPKIFSRVFHAVETRSCRSPLARKPDLRTNLMYTKETRSATFEDRVKAHGEFHGSKTRKNFEIREKRSRAPAQEQQNIEHVRHTKRHSKLLPRTQR